MPKDNPDMSLGARAAQFQALLAASEFTDGNGRLSPEDGIARAMQILRAARERSSHVYLVGNGGSAGIASHATTDFVNVAKLRAQTVHDSSLLTCMANDYGYENAFARILSQLAGRDDVLVAISSSGKSANIRNAAAAVRQKGGQVLTLSGFERGNPLRVMGDLNIWLDSRDYGFVEIGHQFILHNIADRFGWEHKAG
jgi:D-sedoheptulose 7-phosphate isomerase